MHAGVMDTTDENCSPAASTNGGEFLVDLLLLYKTVIFILACTLAPLCDAEDRLIMTMTKSLHFMMQMCFNVLQSIYNLQA